MCLVPVAAQVQESYTSKDPADAPCLPAQPGSSGGHGVQRLGGGRSPSAHVISWRSASPRARWGMTVPDLVREASWLARYDDTDALTHPGI